VLDGMSNSGAYQRPFVQLSMRTNNVHRLSLERPRWSGD